MLDIVVTEDAVVEVGATVAVIGEDSVEDLTPEPEPESAAPVAAQTISPDRVEKLPRIRRRSPDACLTPCRPRRN